MDENTSSLTPESVLRVPDLAAVAPPGDVLTTPSRASDLLTTTHETTLVNEAQVNKVVTPEVQTVEMDTTMDVDAQIQQDTEIIYQRSPPKTSSVLAPSQPDADFITTINTNGRSPSQQPETATREEDTEPKEELVNANEENDDDDDDDLDEDEYIVEGIRAHIVEDKNTIKFQVKWEGWDDPNDLTWEPEETLREGASKILDDYLASIGGRAKALEESVLAKKKKRGRPSVGAKTSSSNAPAKPAVTTKPRGRRAMSTPKRSSTSTSAASPPAKRSRRGRPSRKTTVQDDDEEETEEGVEKEDEEEEQEDNDTEEDAGSRRSGRAATRQSGRNTRTKAVASTSKFIDVKWAPPSGSWENHVEIMDVENSDDGGSIVIYLLWKNGMKTKHPADVVYRRCPQKMLKYYEQHIRIIPLDE